MAKNKGLGRGLDAIFYDNSIEEEQKSEGGVTTIRISMIEPKKDQPRRSFDREALASLADSIAANGVLQPIIVRESETGMYSIIAGERRWRASKLAGLSEIPAIVVDADEFAAAKIAMIENLQREDLNPMERSVTETLWKTILSLRRLSPLISASQEVPLPTRSAFSISPMRCLR